MTRSVKDAGTAVQGLGTCTTNTTAESQHAAKVEYHHLWSYAQQAALIAVSDLNKQDGSYRLITDPERRARRIAGHYAELYFRSAAKSNGKVQFRWPALAAFVVKDIVEAFRFAREEVLQREWKNVASAARNSGMADLGSLMMTDSSPYQHAIRTYSALAKGNLWLFMDIYPWLWFFLEYGINPDATLNRQRLESCLPHRNWQTFQKEARQAVEELPFGPNWMGRLSTRLQDDAVYRHAGAAFDVEASWSPDGGYGQRTFAASQAHLYCRRHVAECDGGYRTPLSKYWGKFKEAYYVMEAEHLELGRMTKNRQDAETIAKLRQFSSTLAISEAYSHLSNQYKATKSDKLILQKKELVAIAQQEQVNVLQPLIYNDPLLKVTMDTNHSFSRRTGGWISPQFKVIFTSSATNHDPKREAVFDAPDGIIDQIKGTKKSLANEADRMEFVQQIARKFNDLMAKELPLMEEQLRRIAEWTRS
jgi:hypothetical protein